MCYKNRYMPSDMYGGNLKVVITVVREDGQ